MTFECTGIDHIQLAAPPGCEDEARAFFTGVLGWREIPKPTLLQQRGGVWFQCGAHQVHIGVQQEGFAPATKAHPAFRVLRLEELRRKLRERGIPIIDDEARSEEGAERFYTNDPFGNRLEFIEWRNEREQ